MKNAAAKIFFLFFIFCGTPAFAQQDSIPSGNLWPVGGCPLPPRGQLVSFMLTIHSSDGREAKVYYEIKVNGNTIPEEWKKFIRKLPRRSTVDFSRIVVMENGKRKILPAVKYTMW